MRNIVRGSFLLALAPLATFAAIACSSSNDDAAGDAGAHADASGGGSRSTGSTDAGLTSTQPQDGGSTDATLANGSDGAAGDAAVDAGPAAPAAAAAAGFTHLVFEDDFTTDDTIAPTLSAASGYKWYWSFQVKADPTPWAVHTTSSAASIGDAGPGSNASDAGGILTINGPGQPNSAVTTVPGWALGAPDASAPPEGQGNWQHAYFEAYLQTSIDGAVNGSSDQSNGWPAFWSWSVQALKNFGYGLSPITTANYSEIDFFETYGTIFGQTPGNWTATMHQWPKNDGSDGDNNKTDSGWHTYGCLWTSTGEGQGQVKFYFDGKQVDHTIDSGTGQTQFSLETMSQFLILGSGKGWDLNVDWVRVWQ